MAARTTHRSGSGKKLYAKVIIAVTAVLVVFSLRDDCRAAQPEYIFSKRLTEIAAKYHVRESLRGIDYNDFLAFTEVVATERARTQRTEIARDEDYEFGLALGCIPIPNWPKEPPPYPPPPSELLVGAATKPEVREKIRASLDKEILKLPRSELRERGLTVNMALQKF